MYIQFPQWFLYDMKWFLVQYESQKLDIGMKCIYGSMSLYHTSVHVTICKQSTGLFYHHKDLLLDML
jgi:hypothetical protein